MPRCRESRDPRRVSVGPVPPAAAVPPLSTLARRGGQTIRSSEPRAAGLHRSLPPVSRVRSGALAARRVSCLAAARPAAHAHAARKRGSNETRITNNRRCAIAVVVAGRPRAAIFKPAACTRPITLVPRLPGGSAAWRAGGQLLRRVDWLCAPVLLRHREKRESHQTSKAQHARLAGEGESGSGVPLVLLRRLGIGPSWAALPSHTCALGGSAVTGSEGLLDG